ncbi:class I SAM-dependent methyltransferase [Gordonia sp. Z-3]|jgi:SAM-dependent methyltransferase|uniref:Class I SAM-dependent methyltransferase n=2 Tax=Gordonia TaxID=2053 RepID=A0A9X3I754_9ACTN|nr:MULTISPECIES: class I SAM-dependent methyltransferase [Gordonia]MAU82407.1 SAM-dependent methyltransferase [Gordonia sp. (in: high G+C Gram-positive bacteria)]MCF3939591.1 class I SAM-dependent methyltransferase [Gordonia tangerina]MCX2966735.1 class I SAM-dependent methyltransferase [Gordonia aquimaris]MED5802726.1 class I SAM-dependent methyltransferase [Gordonia sp. Z-3]
MTTSAGAPNPFDAMFASRHTVLRRTDGSAQQWPVHRWCDTDSAADDLDRQFDTLVADRCHGATIDLGCGPGRLVDELVTRRLIALGVDSSTVAVAMARARGVTVLHRDIHGPLPGEGRWTTALLIDGNIGIGGAPDRVLSRAAALVRPGGTVLVEIDPAVEHIEYEEVRVEGDSYASTWFPWARIGLLGAESLCHGCGLTILGTWEHAGRQVVEMIRP